MTLEPREELISAYLDDELSADQRAQVESWLAESAECRQLYEELRAVRARLQSLPRLRLEQDLGPAVLRRAERSVLSGAQPPAAAADDEDASAGKPALADAVRQWWARGGKRRILWPVVALAAALLIAMFDTQREPPEREVAQNAPRKLSERGADGVSRDAKDQAVPQMSARHADTPLSLTPGEATTDSDQFGLYADKKVPEQVGRKSKDVMGRGQGGLPAGAAAPAAVEPTEPPATENESTKGDLYRGNAKNSKSGYTLTEPVELVVCDVDPAFIKEQQFERVLNSNKVSFKRMGAEARQRDVQLRSKEQQSQAIGVQELYQVNAAPEQLDQILSVLKQERSQVSNVAITNSAVSDESLSIERRGMKVAPNAVPAKKPDAGERFLYKQPSGKLSEPPVVTFWLRVVEGNEPAQDKK
jgi:hypothetical protein